MKKLGLFIIMISFMACQSEKKADGTVDSTNQSKAIDTLSFKDDSIKVASGLTKAVISYPVFPDTKLNEFIEQKVMSFSQEGKDYKSYNEFATDFIKGYDDFRKKEKDYTQSWYLDLKTEVVKQGSGYISLLNTYVNFSGGAHPNSVFTYLNYDPAAHQEILLDSLIKPGTMGKLTAIAEQIFRKNEKLAPDASLKNNYFFEHDTFKLNNNFTITDKGLKFLYNPYEIKAYVYGTIELTVPFAELGDIARPNSLLSHTN